MGLTQITTGGVDDNINIDSNTLKVDGTNNRVGIGTAAPFGKLQVKAGTNANFLATTASSEASLEIINDAGSANVPLNVRASEYKVKIGSNEKLRLDSSGNVGIGASNNSSYDSIAQNLLVADESGNTGITIRSGGSTPFGAIHFADGTSSNAEKRAGRIIYQHAINTLSFHAADAEAMRIDSSGNVGIGQSNPSGKLEVSGGYVTLRNGASSYPDGISAPVIYGSTGGGSNSFDQTGNLVLQTRSDSGSYNICMVTGDTPTERLRIDSSGNVGIGTTSPQRALVVSDAGTEGFEFYPGSSSGNNTVNHYNRSTASFVNSITTADQHIFGRADGEKMRIDSSGRLMLGTTTEGFADVADNFTIADSSNCGMTIRSGSSSAGSIYFSDGDSGGAGEYAGYIDYNHSSNALRFGTNGGNERMRIDSSGVVKLTQSGNNPRFGSLEASGDAFKLKAFSGNASHNATMQFFTGANSPSERMRIVSSGDVLIGNTTAFSGSSSTETGHRFESIGVVSHFRNSGTALYVGRQGNDGQLVSFRQAGSEEGSISVSGTTVSYNGAHLSRWSQLASGAARTEILRGSVLSNLDEMCEWGEEDNEQLNRMQVSSVEGDRNVSGVFQAWDDDDDTYVNDFYCAMTGDFVIRIAQGTTVARGDLLMSAGDGTAKPQDDDIVRSKTIAKVTSTTVSTTYSDNSYCVPCVLMAC